MNAKNNLDAQALSLAQVASLLAIGQLALEHQRATAAANAAKNAYHEVIRDYESGETRIDFNGPGSEELKAETAVEFAAYQAAKRLAHNINRRLQRACAMVVS